VLAHTPWEAAARAAENRLGLIRVFNYHGTPRRYGALFGLQIDHLLTRYDPVDPYRLEQALAEGPAGGRPLAVFTFDDGLRNHFTVAAAALEKRGIRGIFCIPVEFPSLSPPDQIDWFRKRVRPTPNAEHAHDDDLYAMSWDEARQLVARGHRICCHSLSHEVLDRNTPRRRLEAEIIDSKERLEEKLGVPVDGFCWPVQRDPQATVALELFRATYSYGLSGDTRPVRKNHDPLDVYRTRLEASWPLEAVDMQISGIIDLIFALRRLRNAMAMWFARNGEGKPADVGP
jgi:peptidoglycan/xylan/chitin deacetylase (PgdA/CDA1 family)